MIVRRQVSVPTRLALAAARDLTLPLYNTMTLIVFKSASVVINAFFAFTVRCYFVVCILASTCNSSLTPIVSNYGSTDLSVARAHSRSQSIRRYYTFEHSRLDSTQYFVLGFISSYHHFTHGVGDTYD